MKGGKFEQDYVRIASFIYLRDFKDKFNHDTSGVLFNKYLTLLNRDLKNQKGVDIKLAHCWYRWGDVVVRQDLNYLQWTHSDLSCTEVSYKDDEPNYLSSDPVVRFIRSYSKKFIERFGDDKEGVETAVDEVYQQAPLDFQRDYRVLRESLKISKSNVPYDNYQEYLSTLFKKAMSSFPDNKFRNVKKQKDAFEAVFMHSLESDVPNEGLFDMAEDFWFYFCYHLRLKYNENVSQGIKNSWKSKIPLETSRYDASIQNYAYQYCRDSKDPAIIGLLKDREDRLKELDQLMEGLDW